MIRIAAFAAVLGGTILGPLARVTVPAPRQIPLFVISKSENKNQVQYAIAVDDHCAPIAGAPILAYWRMLERGATRTEPLLAHELPAYGVDSQSVTARDADGGKVRLVLKAVPTRPVLVETFRSASGACEARSTVTIGGAPAHLFDVYAKLKWPVGVDYLLLRGWSMDGARVLSEKLSASHSPLTQIPTRLGSEGRASIHTSRIPAGGRAPRPDRAS
jgi:hypothetical protein